MQQIACISWVGRVTSLPLNFTDQLNWALTNQSQAGFSGWPTRYLSGLFAEQTFHAKHIVSDMGQYDTLKIKWAVVQKTELSKRTETEHNRWQNEKKHERKFPSLPFSTKTPVHCQWQKLVLPCKQLLAAKFSFLFPLANLINFLPTKKLPDHCYC